LTAAVSLVNGQADLFHSRVDGWPMTRWEHLELVLVMHGLNPWLWETLGEQRLAKLLPAHTLDLVASQHAANAQRIDALHADLVTVLHAAAQAGIAVMPLKGALITTLDGRTRRTRPMADLDLLVRPHEREAMARALSGLGYKREAQSNPRPTHDVFMNPGGGRIVSNGEHADNPRRVELHTEVMRHLWGWIDSDALTPALWSGSHEGLVLGEPAWLPKPEAFASHIAIHASSDLLVRRGRLVQWLDLAELPAANLSHAHSPHPELTYPALALAGRALPELAGSAADAATALRPRVPRSVVRWTSRVPIDDRAGLMLQTRLLDPSSWPARWSRWAPYRWRLGVAFGDMPLPLALAHHGAMLRRQWATRS